MNIKAQIYNQLKLVEAKHTTGIIIATSNSSSWKIYCFLGKIIWAEGGIHPNRYLQRQIKAVNFDGKILDIDLNSEDNTNHILTGYHYIKKLLLRKIISGENAMSIVRKQLEDILFDLVELEQLSLAEQRVYYRFEQITPHSFLKQGFKTSLGLIDIPEAISNSQQAWHTWVKNDLIDYSPNLAPRIVKEEILKNIVPRGIYNNLTKYVNGNNTLRDLAVIMNKDLTQLTKSLVGYINKGLITLASVQDIANFTKQQPRQYKNQSVNKSQVLKKSKQPLIICVDDSPQICKTMERIITRANYRFLGIEDSLRAIPLIIAQQPDLIFLDLNMPIVNGYELCSNLRRIPQFAKTPIVILTGNDGIIDRVRAKMVGCSEYMTKPVQVEEVLGKIKTLMPLNNTLINKIPA